MAASSEHHEEADCKVCYRLDIQDFNAFGYGDLEKTAEGGCQNCWIILEGIHRFRADLFPRATPHTLMLTPIGDNQGDTSVYVDVTDETGEDKQLKLFFYSTGEPPKPWNKLQVTRHLYPDPCYGLDSATTWLRQCLDECERSHVDCQQLALKTKPLPTRVLDVGTTSVDTITLMHTNGITAPYNALSHCWGSAQPLTTTQNTISERQKGIALQDLPKTFRDAVAITRNLGIRYLWIDSLCIVQDDAADWEAEASKMAAVYSGSYLTFAAMSARDGREGCIPQHGAMRYTEIPEAQERGYSGVSARLHGLNNAHLAISGNYNSQRVPLVGVIRLSRAWVYQERLLSHRVAFFNHLEMFWECKTCVQCECGEINPKVASPEKVHSVHPELEQISASEVQETWETVMKNYSNLALTKTSDRLPALSGIASTFAGHTESTYLAGMWRAHMPQSLLWHANLVETSDRGTAQGYIAPSWSWASLLFPVAMSNHVDLHADFSILDIWCRVTGQNPYGQVSDGRLRVRGQCIESAATTVQFIPHWSFALNFKDPGHDVLRFQTFYPDDSESCKSLDGTIVPWTLLVVESKDRSSSPSSMEVVGLVLRQKSGGQDNHVYERVGLATAIVYNPQHWTGWPVKELEIV